MQLTGESQSIREGSARHVDYAYDKAANVLTLTYPSGTTLATSYDALGRGDVLKRDGKQIADYDYLGQRLKALTFETGTDDVQLTPTFDGVGRLTRMTYAQTGNTGLPDFSYGFDAASNITRKGFEHRSGAPSEDYGYDTLHRLTRTTFGQRTAIPYEGFVYDHLGNHLVQDDNGTTVAGLFNAVNEQTKRGATALSHDLRGNLTADDTSGGRVYLYDRQNLLTRVEDGSSNRIASYAYDALGRRIEKDVQGGAVTEFYWNGQQLVEETDVSGAVKRRMVWSPSGGYIDDLVQFIDRTGGSDVAYFACRHHNFNVVALLSSSGGVVERYHYNPYGKRFVLNSDYSDDADGLSDVALQVGHQGLYHDAETGLVYNRARMLHVVLGRFVQRDPLEYVDGASQYQYQRAHVITNLDPRGLFRLGPYFPPHIFVPTPVWDWFHVNQKTEPVDTGLPSDNCVDEYGGVAGCSCYSEEHRGKTRITVVTTGETDVRGHRKPNFRPRLWHTLGVNYWTTQRKLEKFESTTSSCGCSNGHVQWVENDSETFWTTVEIIRHEWEARKTNQFHPPHNSPSPPSLMVGPDQA